MQDVSVRIRERDIGDKWLLNICCLVSLSFCLCFDMRRSVPPVPYRSVYALQTSAWYIFESYRVVDRRRAKTCCVYRSCYVRLLYLHRVLCMFCALALCKLPDVAPPNDGGDSRK